MAETVKALDLHIVIVGTEPEIWRDLRIPADTPLSNVHLVIQRSFGWKDQHLYVFSITDDSGVRRHYAGNEETAMELEWETSQEITLGDVVGGEGGTLGYEYDFGDSWDHEITVTGHALAPSGQFICTGGASRGPVEDSGGIGGYHKLCGILSDSRNPEYQEKAQWFSFVTGNAASNFDPAALDINAVNTSLDLLGVRLAQDKPTAEEMADVVRPAKWLLQRVGADGLELTKDGYLKPAVVAEIMAGLGWDQRWIGKFNREAQTPPVLELHARMREWKLLRKYKGKLVRTPAGRKVYDDDAALWDYLADALSRFENSALELGSRLVIDWLLEERTPPFQMLGGAMADSLTYAGFRMPDNAQVPEDQGHAVYFEIKRALGCLDIFDLKRDYADRRRPTEGGLKFLLELQRRQGPPF